MEVLAEIKKKELELNALIRQHQLASGRPYGLEAVKIPQGLLDGCRLYRDRWELVRAIRLHDPVIAEVGTMTGGFAKFLIDTLKPKSIEIIDITFAKFKHEFVENQQSTQINLREGDSSTIMAEYPDEHFDLVYLDGSHTPLGVERDMSVVPAKIKSGGILIMNDYISYSIHDTCEYGVQFQFNKLVAENNWKVSHFAFHPRGYFDIAAQKP